VYFFAVTIVDFLSLIFVDAPQGRIENYFSAAVSDYFVADFQIYFRISDPVCFPACFQVYGLTDAHSFADMVWIRQALSAHLSDRQVFHAVTFFLLQAYDPAYAAESDDSAVGCLAAGDSAAADFVDVPVPVFAVIAIAAVH